MGVAYLVSVPMPTGLQLTGLVTVPFSIVVIVPAVSDRSQLVMFTVALVPPMVAVHIWPAAASKIDVVPERSPKLTSQLIPFVELTWTWVASTSVIVRTSPPRSRSGIAALGQFAWSVDGLWDEGGSWKVQVPARAAAAPPPAFPPAPPLPLFPAPPPPPVPPPSAGLELLLHPASKMAAVMTRIPMVRMFITG